VNNRLWQFVLIASTILASWLGMQAIHELGHVLGAHLTGGVVTQVVLNPLTISRTDVSPNPRPLIEVWAGPMVGSVVPLVAWAIAALVRMPGVYVLRFFAGFCLLANGLYIGFGSLTHVGDAGELLHHGASAWQLALFGIVVAPPGLWLWNGQGKHFGLGDAHVVVSPRVALATLVAFVALALIGFAVGGS
jgi:hypothetical protein